MTLGSLQARLLKDGLVAIAVLHAQFPALWEGDLAHRRSCQNPNDFGCRLFQAVELVEQLLREAAEAIRPPSDEQTANISDAIAEHCAKFGDLNYSGLSLDQCVRQLVEDYDSLEKEVREGRADRPPASAHERQQIAAALHAMAAVQGSRGRTITREEIAMVKRAADLLDAAKADRPPAVPGVFDHRSGARRDSGQALGLRARIEAWRYGWWADRATAGGGLPRCDVLGGSCPAVPATEHRCLSVPCPQCHPDDWEEAAGSVPATEEP